MLPRNSSVVETICPTRGETGSLFYYSFCSRENTGENTCKPLETECKILISSFQHSSLPETCEAINDNLLPSNLSHVLGNNQNDCFSHQASYKIHLSLYYYFTRLFVT